VNLHVLVIDDDNSVRASLLRVLRGGGYVAAQASDGKEGLVKALRLQPDVILLDVVMNGQSGIETARALKNQASLAAVPIIALTASPESARQAGALFAAVLTKPCLSEDLFRTIDASAPHRRPIH
jgi:CheY-like chemotaxis protein